MKCPFLKGGRFCIHCSNEFNGKHRCNHPTRCRIIEESNSKVAYAFKEEKDAAEELKTAKDGVLE